MGTGNGEAHSLVVSEKMSTSVENMASPNAKSTASCSGTFSPRLCFSCASGRRVLTIPTYIQCDLELSHIDSSPRSGIFQPQTLFLLCA